MKTIYIFTNGTTLRKVGQRLILENRESKIFELPIKDVERILIYCNTEITTQTIRALLDVNIPIYYTQRSGSLKGKMMPAMDHHVLLRQAQYQKFSDPQFSIPLARTIIRTKIKNMQAVVEHILRKENGTAAMCQSFQNACQNLEKCNSFDEIMGVEGAAASHYFQIYGKQFPAPFQFEIRSRRPAQDAANAVLNLGYMTLMREVLTHIEAHSLDPYLGILHCTYERRPALALDLLEEFRQPIVDLFVIKLFRMGQLKPEHFQTEAEEGIRITEDGLKTFFSLYEKQMGNQDGNSPGLRKILDEQVGSLKQHTMGQGMYRPFLLETFSNEIENPQNL